MAGAVADDPSRAGPPALRLPFAPAPPLRTERLLLRPWRQDDAELLLDLYGRESVNRWLYTTPLTREQLPERLGHKLARHALTAETPLNLVALEAATGAFVGDLALRVWSAQHGSGEIGFTLHPEMEGRGYATEAARELLRLAFAEAGFSRVIARLEARNAGSARVAERLGMRREAHFVDNEWVKGAWESEVVYALLAREWRAQQARG